MRDDPNQTENHYRFYIHTKAPHKPFGKVPDHRDPGLEEPCGDNNRSHLRTRRLVRRTVALTSETIKPSDFGGKLDVYRRNLGSRSFPDR